MKSRLQDFQAASTGSPYQKVGIASPEYSSTTHISKTSQVDIEMGNIGDAPMDIFLATIDGIRIKLEKINKSVNDIETLHRQALHAISLEEATKLGRMIDELVSRTNQESQQVQIIIKQMTKETEAFKSSEVITPSDLRIRSTQQARWSKKFMATMKRFQQVQQTYQNKYRQTLERQYLIIKPDATRTELDDLTHGSADSAATLLQQQVFASASKAMAQKTLAEMKERHHDILSIEKSINELHQMYLDMALVVEQQGDLIEKLNDYVESTADYTEYAAEEMRTAVQKQRSSQKRKWILIVIALVLIIVIGVSLFVSLMPDSKK